MLRKLNIFSTWLTMSTETISRRALISLNWIPTPVRSPPGLRNWQRS
jgi:hypothetical protein